MGFFKFISDLFVSNDSGSSDVTSSSFEMTQINPATGLPMIGSSMVDVAGNPYGTDISYSSGTDSISTFDCSVGSDFNPANGLPMMSDSCFDVAGNVYGTDSSLMDSGSSFTDHSSCSSSFDDSWSSSSFDSSCSSSFDDSWSSGSSDW